MQYCIIFDVNKNVKISLLKFFYSIILEADGYLNPLVKRTLKDSFRYQENIFTY